MTKTKTKDSTHEAEIQRVLDWAAEWQARSDYYVMQEPPDRRTTGGGLTHDLRGAQAQDNAGRVRPDRLRRKDPTYEYQARRAANVRDIGAKAGELMEALAKDGGEALLPIEDHDQCYTALRALQDNARDYERHYAPPPRRFGTGSERSDRSRFEGLLKGLGVGRNEARRLLAADALRDRWRSAEGRLWRRSVDGAPCAQHPVGCPVSTRPTADSAAVNAATRIGPDEHLDPEQEH